jgi:hypothetical protein
MAAGHWLTDERSQSPGPIRAQLTIMLLLRVTGRLRAYLDDGIRSRYLLGSVVGRQPLS